MSNWKTTMFLAVGMLALGTGCVEPPTIVVQPLRVINWAPASGTVCVDIDAEVFVTFSDDIVVDTLTADSLQLRDAAGVVATSLDYDKSAFTATLTPSTTLDYEAVYTVVAGTEVTGAEQGPLPVVLESSFQTVGRVGCTPGAECQLASDCPGSQVCSAIGVCIDQCVTNRDCPSGTVCNAGSCN